MRGVSIKFKVTLIISLSLLLTILLIAYVSTSTQTKNLLDASEKALSTSTSILNATIKNLMLNGEAPVVVQTFTEMKTISDIEELGLYRTDGTTAFHDFATLDTVNRNLGRRTFKKTDRLPLETIDSVHFRRVLETNTPARVDLKNTREIEYYFPILNAPDCRRCHGSDHLIRGVAYFRMSTVSVYEQIQRSNMLLIGVFVVAGVIIGIVLSMFLKRVIVKPLLSIGLTVRDVSEGKFDSRVTVRRKDEVGELGNEINRMIQGLEERFRLSKYVSNKTERLIRQRAPINTDGERQNITVLFSDIRSFTSFSERHPPKDVIAILNKILQVQAVEVERAGGDVDKFIGDAIMAIFTSEYDAVLCAYRMIACVQKVNRENRTGLHVGIGINAGEVILGNIGSETRIEYAAVGDTVNVAARLSGIAKPDMILISESVMRALEGRVEVKRIPNQTIKGKMAPINFYVVQSILDKKTMNWVR